MLDEKGPGRAFENFRALNGTPNIGECDNLIRNMAHLFSHVASRCDDEQVAQYDEVLCQLADLVETEARVQVAQLFAPLERAPGTVVLKLANDDIEVAQPLLEFSNVLSDDDLIDIVGSKSEKHRVAIAGRQKVTDRVGGAIVEHGQSESISKLVNNENAEIGSGTLPKLMSRANGDADLANVLRARKDIDWKAVNIEVGEAGRALVRKVVKSEAKPDDPIMSQAQAVAYNRIRNRAGFDATEWKIAWNQVKALSDRKRLDAKSLERFARFGYGHHVAAGLTVLLNVKPEIVVKWLATQDYVAMTVAARALGLTPQLFEAVASAVPWRNSITPDDLENVRTRFETLSAQEAKAIFELWRAHSFRRRETAPETAVATEQVASAV
ncbi:MAG: DUF2336 domain-containing protein [Alphaproteobacteria bacterium]|nr:DUF2336 domain-containing protein [Alphaproteobacteria bacterium]